jgi:hypothetical protein
MAKAAFSDKHSRCRETNSQIQRIISLFHCVGNSFVTELQTTLWTVARGNGPKPKNSLIFSLSEISVAGFHRFNIQPLKSGLSRQLRSYSGISHSTFKCGVISRVLTHAPLIVSWSAAPIRRRASQPGRRIFQQARSA